MVLKTSTGHVKEILTQCTINALEAGLRAVTKYKYAAVVGNPDCMPRIIGLGKVCAVLFFCEEQCMFPRVPYKQSTEGV